MKKLLLIVPIALFLLFTQSCEKDSDSVETPKALAIGDFHQGGIIFYLDSSKIHGLVCAPTEQSVGTEWGCLPEVVHHAKGLLIGTGAQNTKDIISVCSSSSIAAALCHDLILNGYEDWFLPSRDELRAMHVNLNIINPGIEANGGELIQKADYWSSSSSDTDDKTAWVQGMEFGAQYTNTVQVTYHVRAVREF